MKIAKKKMMIFLLLKEKKRGLLKKWKDRYKKLDFYIYWFVYIVCIINIYMFAQPADDDLVSSIQYLRKINYLLGVY